MHNAIERAGISYNSQNLAPPSTASALTKHFLALESQVARMHQRRRVLGHQRWLSPIFIKLQRPTVDSCLQRALAASGKERTSAAAGNVTKSSTEVCGGREPLRRPRPGGGVGSGHCFGRFSEARVRRHSSAIGPDAPWVMSSSSPRAADHTSSTAGTAGTAVSAAAASAASSTSHFLPYAMAALIDGRRATFARTITRRPRVDVPRAGGNLK